MRTISIDDFKALVSRPDWHREQDHDVVDAITTHSERWNRDEDELERIEIRHAYGWASQTSALDGITITYTEGIEYYECDPDSLSTSIDGLDDVWAIDGITVLNDDGEPVCAADLADYLPITFSDIDYSVLEIEQTTDIGITEDSDMDTITLEIDNAPDIRFTGERIARVSSSPEQAMGSSYSGQTGRWTTLALYRTANGKYICHQIGHTQWQGERTRYSGAVCATLDEVREFFGHRWLAKELYEEAGIDSAVDVA